jgi:hypothetical protein
MQNAKRKAKSHSARVKRTYYYEPHTIWSEIKLWRKSSQKISNFKFQINFK